MVRVPPSTLQVRFAPQEPDETPTCSGSSSGSVSISLSDKSSAAISSEISSASSPSSITPISCISLLKRVSSSGFPTAAPSVSLSKLSAAAPSVSSSAFATSAFGIINKPASNKTSHLFVVFIFLLLIVELRQTKAGSMTCLVCNAIVSNTYFVILKETTLLY